MSFSEWKKYKLGDVIDLKSGKSRPKEIGDYPVYGGNGILNYTNRYNVSDDTIIIGRVGAYCGSVYFEKRNIWVSDNALFAKPKNGFNAKFLFYYLKLRNLNTIAGGSSHPLLSQGQLNNLDVELPLEATQQRIALILSSLDDKIELNRQSNQTLETIAQNLFKEMCLPKGDNLPDGWRVGKLGEVCDIIKGVSYRSSELVPSNFALVTLKSMNRGGGLNFNGFKEFSGKYKPSQILLEGDVVIAQTDLTQNADVVGCPAIVENPYNYEKLIASIDLVKCQSKDGELTNEVLFYFLQNQTFKDFCLSHTNGSTVLHLRSSELSNYEFVIPSKKVLNGFDKLVKSIRKSIINTNKETQTLKSIRDSLLPKLINGEINIKN